MYVKLTLQKHNGKKGVKILQQIVVNSVNVYDRASFKAYFLPAEREKKSLNLYG